MTDWSSKPKYSDGLWYQINGWFIGCQSLILMTDLCALGLHKARVTALIIGLIGLPLILIVMDILSASKYFFSQHQSGYSVLQLKCVFEDNWEYFFPFFFFFNKKHTYVTLIRTVLASQFNILWKTQKITPISSLLRLLTWCSVRYLS